jgi:hypothetical protein
VRNHASLHCGLTWAPYPFTRGLASFFDLSLFLKAFEKNGIAAKQFVSRANVAIPMDDPNVFALGVSLQRQLRWSRIYSA